MSTTPRAYPVTFDAGLPSEQSRLTVFFRILLAWPHLIVLNLLQIAVQLTTFIAWFAILITGRYPRGLLTFAIGYQRWQVRVIGHLFLLTCTYPPFAFDAPDYPVRVEVAERVEGRNRLTAFFRLILVIPHFVALSILGVALLVAWVVAWVVALFTAQVPAGLHNFIAGYLRWYTRVSAYLLLLVDEYPPFSLN